MKQSLLAQFAVKNLDRNSRSEQGFTLIELLVTVIIIGVLAALSLPNLLAQVGKARDIELRSTIGTINRAQQAFHFEHRFFSTDVASLGVTVTRQYQAQPLLDSDTTTYSTIRTDAPSFQTNATKAYAGRIDYSTLATDYSVIVCGSNAPAQNITAPVSGSTCPAGSGAVR